VKLEVGKICLQKDGIEKFRGHIEILRQERAVF
jgi:hypothetical protein